MRRTIKTANYLWQPVSSLEHKKSHLIKIIIMTTKVEHYNYCYTITSTPETAFCKFYCMCISMFWIVLPMCTIDLDLVIHYFVHKNIYYFIFHHMRVETIFNIWIFVENYSAKERDFYSIIVHSANHYLRYSDISLITTW